MNVYRENIKKLNARIERLQKKLNILSLLRLFIFLVSCALLIHLLKFKLFTLILIVSPLLMAGFGAVIRYYNKNVFWKRHTEFLKRINESEILRGACQLEGFDNGSRFVNHRHPYTSDLDIFGQHSIFQLVNRTTTESGTLLLAKWLSEPAPDVEIYERQKATKELASKLGWRQDFHASGMHFQNKESDYFNLLKWAEAPVALLKRRRLYTATAIILSVLSLAGLYIFLNKLISSNINTSNWYFYLLPFIAVLFVNNRILSKVKPIADNIVETSQEHINTFRGYRILIQKIESEHFRSKKLDRLQSLLKINKNSASSEINRLCRLLEFAQQRGINKIKMPIKGNAFYSLLNSFLLLDIYLITGVEKWKSKNKSCLKSWIEAVSGFEVLNSFAGFCFSNPSYAFPEITEKNNLVHFEWVGHPLIPAGRRVCNDFSSEGRGDVVMITGSNMGGKSTFLRTIGVNIVLALAGAPCCAKYGQVSNLKLFTSMRTRDNLKEGISSFYAELERIKSLLKLTESSHIVFFLLDEMFKGTNSEDRHKGGFSLIHQVSRMNASGIIATHDIQLARLAENKKLVTNYSFNSAIKNGYMHFSYKLHRGICNDFNACELMARSGIVIMPDVPDIKGHNSST